MEQIEWESLGFGYIKTPYNIRATYKDGAWGEIEIHTEERLNLHIAATCLHYGQEAFEGLKAFRCKDGKVRIFRMEENAKRMQRSAAQVLMAQPSIELFCEAVTKAIELNASFIPTYESGASLYIRPLLIGSGAQVGVKPAKEYTFIVFVTPVGPYFSGGAMKAVISREYDRAAPHGTGHVKVGGNYAASLCSQEEAHERGYEGVIYLDPRTQQYVDECGAANFFGIKDNTYVTPNSHSTLPSITNMSLRQIAKDMGMNVEERNIPIAELATFTEAGACGTAAVITPVGLIDDLENGVSYTFGNTMGETTKKLRETIIAIQHGELDDKYGWNTILDI